jgi:hypothetical protein
MNGCHVNHRHRKILHALFDHPISGNISFKDVEAVLGELGAVIDNRHGARVGVTLNGHTAVFHHAQRALTKDDVVRIKKFITQCGVDPARDYPLAG